MSASALVRGGAQSVVAHVRPAHPKLVGLARSQVNPFRVICPDGGKAMLERLTQGVRRSRLGGQIPLPPEEMRGLIGLPGAEDFIESARDPFPVALGVGAPGSVFDFGCGCGRLARHFMQLPQPPGHYLGVDLHLGLINWCRRNLTAWDPNFQFSHHDVANEMFNPGAGKERMARFAAGDAEFDFAVAWSVFTHLLEPETPFYLRELRRLLTVDGLLATTWFLFDKALFPMMQDFQNALFINELSPSNAVIYDRQWMRDTAAEAGLTIVAAIPPEVRGFHWLIAFRPSGPGVFECPIPPDDSPIARRSSKSSPLLPQGAERIGL